LHEAGGGAYWSTCQIKGRPRARTRTGPASGGEALIAEVVTGEWRTSAPPTARSDAKESAAKENGEAVPGKPKKI
jgi:hypothetical protein